MYRFFCAFPIALCISYGLLAVMAWMVDLDVSHHNSPPQPLQFDIVMTETKPSSQRKKRLLSSLSQQKLSLLQQKSSLSQQKSSLSQQKPPLSQQKPPSLQAMEIKPPTEIETPALSRALKPVPKLTLDFAVSDIPLDIPALTALPQQNITKPVSGAALVQHGQSQPVMPLYRVEPVYPRKALQRRIEGYVILSFDIDKSGRTENIVIKAATPPRIFNKEAIKALTKWQYQPLMVNGKAQRRTGQRVKLEFQIK